MIVSNGAPGKRPSLYLAGGFRTDWQRHVHERLGTRYEILDPREHGLEEPAAYTHWDLEAIKRCDVILAYMEETNPGGYALALEVGYAKALGKRIVVVLDELPEERIKYFEMVRAVADFSARHLHEAIAYLTSSPRSVKARDFA